jgi:phosphate transport system ATP-binding protein
MQELMKSHISVRDLSVSYGNLQVLKNISVNVPDRQITAIIGPSGCGKTTLLKCFNRLIDLNEEVKVSGSVMVDGVDIYNDRSVDPTEIRKKMGLLFQKPFPLPMSIYDNIVYGARLHGALDRSTLDNIVEKQLKVVGLWDEVKDRLGGPAVKLSAGQQQRLCLARGLAVEPEAILADEPTSALDPISAQHIEKAFNELKKNYTVVLVTHILRQARRVADYIIFLYMGELVEHGPAEKVLNNPREKRTQAYVRGEIS